MPLNSLLLCQETVSVHLLTRAFKEFGIGVESHCDAPTAIQRLKNQRFEAVVVDVRDHAAAMLVLGGMKTLPSCKNSLRVVLADRETALLTAFSTGTHLVIYKPISPDRLRNSIAALCNLIGRRYQREFERVQVTVPALLRVRDTHLPASILDISAGGLALSARQAIPNAHSVGLQFMLPGRTSKISITAEVVWNDVHGRIGAQFVDMEPAVRKVICEWIATQLSSKRLQRAAAGKSQT